MKKAKLKVAKPQSDLELRRWCVEQAIRWPWDAGREWQASQYPSPGRGPSAPDILQRAAQIMNWVKGT